MPKVKKDFITSSRTNGFSVLGKSLDSCGKLVINRETFYDIQTYNTEAQAYKNKIVNWIGKSGVYLADENGKKVENKKLTKQVQDVFSDNTFKMFKDKYFTHSFCSGDIYMYPQKNVLGEIKCQLVDSRTITKKIDKLGNIIEYRQTIAGVARTIPGENMYNSITRFNPNNPFYGCSLYESIVFDALAEKETAKKNYYFFKNNATPNVLYMLNPEMEKEQIHLTEEKIKEKYQGTSNSNNFMLSNAVTDAKILDVSYKDLDLIQLREFVIKKMGIVFQIDPRVIGFITDVGAYNSIVAIRKEAKETIDSMSQQLETDINYFYRKFIDVNFKYIIKINSETFDDRDSIEENQRKDVELGIQTLEMIWNERGYDITKLPKEGKKPLIKTNLTFLENQEPLNT